MVADGKALRDAVKAFPDLSEEEIRNAWTKHGGKADMRSWSTEEANKLLALRKEKQPWGTIAESFPGRTLGSLRMKCFLINEPGQV